MKRRLSIACAFIGNTKFVLLGKTIYLYRTESETNRTFPVRVRFGSTEFLKSRFG